MSKIICANCKQSIELCQCEHTTAMRVTEGDETEYTKGKCGCYIEYYEGFKDKPDHIIYCSLHKSAPDLHEALKQAEQDINWMLNNQQFLNPGRFEYIEIALAKANQSSNL